MPSPLEGGAKDYLVGTQRCICGKRDWTGVGLVARSGYICAQLRGAVNRDSAQTRDQAVKSGVAIDLQATAIASDRPFRANCRSAEPCAAAECQSAVVNLGTVCRNLAIGQIDLTSSHSQIF